MGWGIPLLFAWLSDSHSCKSSALKTRTVRLFSGNYIPLNTPIKHFLLDKWQFNVAAGVIGVCCILLDRIITAKKEQIKKETDDNQLAKDYLAWKSSGKKSIES